MMSNDPKQAALVRGGFCWVADVGVWLNEEQRKIVSSRAVQEWNLDELLTFIHKPPGNGGWSKAFSRSA